MKNPLVALLLLPLALAAASDLRPPVYGTLVATEDADYLRRKWREDVTGCGLGVEALVEGGLKRAREKLAAVDSTPWATMFGWLTPGDPMRQRRVATTNTAPALSARYPTGTDHAHVE